MNFWCRLLTKAMGSHFLKTVSSTAKQPTDCPKTAAGSSGKVSDGNDSEGPRFPLLVTVLWGSAVLFKVAQAKRCSRHYGVPN